ncbi:hypothetical protein BU15DRAFT_66242 [Melanogaster broomeanus]|nr:hypothetical protein BU15DRAFT_66242 [Melanogaster broomeanus]
MSWQEDPHIRLLSVLVGEFVKYTSILSVALRQLMQWVVDRLQKFKRLCAGGVLDRAWNAEDPTKFPTWRLGDLEDLEGDFLDMVEGFVGIASARKTRAAQSTRPNQSRGCYVIKVSESSCAAAGHALSRGRNYLLYLSCRCSSPQSFAFREYDQSFAFRARD